MNEMQWCCGDLRQRCNRYIGTATQLRWSMNDLLIAINIRKYNKYVSTFNSNGKGAGRMFNVATPCSTRHFSSSHSKLRSWWRYTCDIDIISTVVLNRRIFPYYHCRWLTFICEFFTICRTNWFRSFENVTRKIKLHWCLCNLLHWLCCDIILACVLLWMGKLRKGVTKISIQSRGSE